MQVFVVWEPGVGIAGVFTTEPKAKGCKENVLRQWGVVPMLSPIEVNKDGTQNKSGTEGSESTEGPT